jgi:hypothetical protein
MSMPKLRSISFRSFLASSASTARWGAIGLTLALLVQASVFYGNQQHLKHAYAAAQSRFSPHTSGGGTAVGTPGVVSFDVAGAGTVSLQGTIAVGIDSAGDVAGVYVDSLYTRHGYVRSANGSITTFDAPNAGTNANPYDYAQGTMPISMDPAGDIVGYYSDANNVYHGFIRTPNGTLTVIDETHALQGYRSGTIVTGVNSAGMVTGYYNVQTGTGNNYSSTIDSFVRAANGTFSELGVPAAVVNYYGGTRSLAINAEGDITGTYTDSADMRHGFVRLASGTLSTFDAPNAALGSVSYSRNAQGTIPLGIDAAGDISGVYTDKNNLSHAFLRSASGPTYTSYDAPNAGTSASAFAGIGNVLPGSGGIGINDSGIVAGAYMDANSVAHGFVRAASGTISSFDAPGAGTGSGGYQGTAGISINASGTVVGTYLDANSVLHGFVYTTTAIPTVTVTPLSSSISASQSLSVTVNVSGGNITPTGSVVLSNGAYTSAATTLTSGTATIVIPASSLMAGTDTLTATYTPDTASLTHYSAGSGTNTVVVSLATTSLVLTANPTSSTYGQQVALTATLSPYSVQSASTNTELVTFYNGNTSLGTGILNSGVASLNVTALPVGTDNLKAVYGGDGNFATSPSAVVPFTVSGQAPTITFAVPNHTYGDSSFTVAATSTSPGAVTYSVVSGPATLSSSTVTLTASGTVVLQASQAASGNYAAATQNAMFTVAGEAQSITFPAPPSLVNYGVAPIALSATSTSSLPVSYRVVSGPGSVNGSTLTITGGGTVVVGADQAGNSMYAAATEVTRSITVSKIAPTSVGLTATPNPVLTQNSVTLTATVSSAVSTPTGSITFLDNTTALGTPVTLVNGVATLNISTLAVGTHPITAQYSGDGAFNGATSSIVNQVVEDFTVTIGTGGSTQTIKLGSAATYTFPVAPSGGSTFPSAVTFTATGLPPGATATFSPASLAAGSSATTVTLTIQVTQLTMLEKIERAGHSLPIAAFAMLLLPFTFKKGRSGKWPKALAMMLIMLTGLGAAAMISGCAGSSTPSTPPVQTGTFNVNVVATSGALSHTTPITLIVQ